MKVLKLSFFKIDVQYMWNMHIILGKKKGKHTYTSDEWTLWARPGGSGGKDPISLPRNRYIAPKRQSSSKRLSIRQGNFCCRGVHMVAQSLGRWKIDLGLTYKWQKNCEFHMSASTLIFPSLLFSFIQEHNTLTVGGAKPAPRPPPRRWVVAMAEEADETTVAARGMHARSRRCSKDLTLENGDAEGAQGCDDGGVKSSAMASEEREADNIGEGRQWLGSDIRLHLRVVGSLQLRLSYRAVKDWRRWWLLQIRFLVVDEVWSSWPMRVGRRGAGRTGTFPVKEEDSACCQPPPLPLVVSPPPPLWRGGMRLSFLRGGLIG